MSAPTGLWQCFDFDSLFCQALNNDVAGGLTYGNIEQLNGASELSISPELLTSENYGDAQILDFFSRIKSAKVQFKLVVNNLNTLPILIGANAQQIGNAPYRQLIVGVNTNPFPYFGLNGQCKYIGPFSNSTGDAHMLMAKCKVAKWDYKWAGEKRHELSGEFMCLPIVYNDPTYGHWIWKMIENETAVTPVATTYNGAGPAISSTNPTMSESGVTTGGPFIATITFNSANAPLNPATVTPNNFVLYDNNSQTYGTVTTSLDNTGFIVTVTAAAGITPAHLHEIFATGVQDIYGNTMAPTLCVSFSA